MSDTTGKMPARQRGQSKKAVPAAVASAPMPKQRKGSVAIVAMGDSIADYFADCGRHGGPSFVDEVWAVNTAGTVIRCDRMFVMDDLPKIMGDPSYQNPIYNGKDPTNGTVTNWCRTQRTTPIYTSRAYKEFPMTREYPIAKVIQAVGSMWFNNSVAYAIALANFEGKALVRLYGCDFYSKKAATENQGGWEHGMACAVHHATLFLEQGGKIEVARNSVFFDTGLDAIRGKLYGYSETPLFKTDKQGNAYHVWPKAKGKAAPSLGEQSRKLVVDPPAAKPKGGKRHA